MNGGKSPSLDDPARLFEAVRRQLLRALVGAMTLAGALVCAIYAFHAVRLGGAPLRLKLYMALLLLMPLLWISQRWLSTMRVALIFVGYLYLTSVFTLALAGLTPGGALLSVFTVLLAALFFGKKGVLTSLFAVLGSLVVMGNLWITGATWGDLAAFNDIRDPLVWARYAVVLAALCGTMAFTFVSLIEELQATAEELAATLQREREERATQLRLREALERSQRMHALGELAAGLAHDIGNSLMVLRSCAELVRRDPGATPSVQALTDQMLESLATTNDTLRQMRYLGHVAMHPTRIAAGEPVGWLERALGAALPPGIQLHANVASSRDLRIDAARLQQALLNLALNARDAMPHGGELTVTATDREVAEVPPGWQAVPGSYVVLDVRDTGFGMDAFTLERMFEPLFTTKGERGTGLGLAMVRTFVHDAHGFVEVESSPGCGTTMRMVLPAASFANRRPDLSDHAVPPA